MSRKSLQADQERIPENGELQNHCRNYGCRCIRTSLHGRPPSWHPIDSESGRSCPWIHRLDCSLLREVVGGYLVIYRSNHPAKQYVEDVEPEPDFSEPQGPEPQSAAEDAAWSAAEDAAWSAAWSAAQTPVSVPVEKPWSTRPEESKQSVVTLRWERTQTLEASVPLSNVRIVTSKDSPVRIGSDEEMVQVTE